MSQAEKSGLLAGDLDRPLLHFDELLADQLEIDTQPSTDVAERVEVGRVVIYEPLFRLGEDLLAVDRLAGHIPAVTLDSVFENGKHELLLATRQSHAPIRKVVLGRMDRIDLIQLVLVFLEFLQGFFFRRHGSFLAQLLVCVCFHNYARFVRDR